MMTMQIYCTKSKCNLCVTSGKCHIVPTWCGLESFSPLCKWAKLVCNIRKCKHQKAAASACGHWPFPYLILKGGRGLSQKRCSMPKEDHIFGDVTFNMYWSAFYSKRASLTRKWCRIQVSVKAGRLYLVKNYLNFLLRMLIDIDYLFLILFPNPPKAPNVTIDLSNFQISQSFRLWKNIEVTYEKNIEGIFYPPKNSTLM